MSQALDIAPGSEQYLPYALHLMRTLKATLVANGQKQGRMHTMTPDGGAFVYLRTQRSGRPLSLTQFAPKGDPIEWYDHIKIDGGGGGYWIGSSIFALGANPALASPLAVGNLFLPFKGGQFVDLGFLLSGPRSIVQHLDDRPLANSRALTSGSTGYVRGGTATPVTFDTYFSSLGFFEHTYTDPDTNEEQTIMLGLSQTAAWMSQNNPIHTVVPGSGGGSPVALTRSGAPTTLTIWGFYVTADGRQMLAHAMGPGSGTYMVDIDYARATQAIWTPFDTTEGSTTGATTNTTAKSDSTKTWIGTQEVRTGSTPWARTGQIEQEVITTNQFSDGPVLTVKDYVGLNADGTRAYITVITDFSSGSGGGTQSSEWTSDADLSQALSSPELAIPPYTQTATTSYQTSGTLFTGQASSITIVVGDTAVEFEGHSTTVTASGTWSETFQSGGGGDYPDPDPAHPYTGSGSSVTVERAGGVSILFADPHSEFVVYVTSHNTTTTTRVGEMEGDMVLGGTSSGSVTTQTTVGATEYGIVSSAHGREALWTEPGSVGAPNTVPMDPQVVIPDVSIAGLQGSPVGWPSFSLGEEPASGTFSFSSGGVPTPGTFTTNTWGTSPPRAIQSNGTTSALRYGFAGRDPRNWICSISRLRVTDGGAFINPHDFWVRTARLDNEAVEEAWYDMMEARLRAVGQTAVADAVRDRNFTGLERDFHQHVLYNSRYNDSVGSYVTDTPRV